MSKRFLLISICLTFIAPFTILNAQDSGFGYEGGDFSNQNQTCLSEEKRIELIKFDQTNRQTLIRKGKLPTVNSLLAVSFEWPLRASNSLSYNNFYGISNYVDHNSAFSGDNNSNVQDFNCGSRSYDTGSGYNHKGTDYFTFPFPWHLMENDQVEVVAAAAGTITTRIDGNPDKNCDFSNNNWNIIIIQHSDGSKAWYGHLKTNSLTSKRVGDNVAAGEYLGVVGSSGASTGPHLHFEIYDDQNNLVDPYAGNCNSLNSTSLWADQHAYYDSKINLVQTQSSPPVRYDCPPAPRRLAERNIKNEFAPGDTIYMLSYYTDQRSGMNSKHTLFRPDGSNFISWDHSMNDSHFAWSYWWWWRILPTTEMQGLWTYQIIFNGDTVNHDFNYGIASSIEPELAEQLIRVSPNPFSDQLTVDWREALEELPHHFSVELTDLMGRQVYEHKGTPSSPLLNIPTQRLASGLYNLRIYSEDRPLIWRKRIEKR